MPKKKNGNPKKNNKNHVSVDEAWRILNLKYHILDEIQKNEVFEISSKMINAEKLKDARLMAKFDHIKNLPRFFRENNLSILPTSNGNYIIGHFIAYKDFPKNLPAPIRILFPANMQSITTETISSENDAIAIAEETGILNRFLNGDSETKAEVYRHSKSSKMRTGDFWFYINLFNSNEKRKITVSHAQIEIDAAYESENELVLIEAKNQMSDDFIVRQLFYPYRKFMQVTKKKIRLIFLVYADNTYTLYEYKFSDPDNYNSLDVAHIESYVFETEMSKQDVLNASTLYTKFVLSNPFPHAIDFQNVDKTLLAFKSNKEELKLTKSSIAERCELTAHDVDICIETLIYFELLEKDINTEEYHLSIGGIPCVNMGKRERFLNFIFLMRLDQTFEKVLKASFKIEHPIGEIGVLSIIKIETLKSNLLSIVKKEFRKSLTSALTADEKAKTLNSWITWIFGNIKKC